MTNTGSGLNGSLDEFLLSEADINLGVYEGAATGLKTLTDQTRVIKGLLLVQKGKEVTEQGGYVLKKIAAEPDFDPQVWGVSFTLNGAEVPKQGENLSIDGDTIVFFDESSASSECVRVTWGSAFYQDNSDPDIMEGITLVGETDKGEKANVLVYPVIDLSSQL